MSKRIDAFEKVTGKAIFADDIHPDNVCYGYPVHSSEPSAKIISVDFASAKNIPGFIDVITVKDVKGSKTVGGLISDQYIFADDRVRYCGDVIALAIAETYESARSVANAIEVKYEKLPALFSTDDALKKTAPRVQDFCKDNIVSSFKVRRGNVKKGFADSAITVEDEFHTAFIEHAYLEPEACVAFPEPDGSVCVHGGMQHPFSTRRFVAKTTGLSLAKARIVQTTLGGGFGGKDDTISVMCARAAIAALKIGRPVKITYTREQSIRESYKRHPFHMKYKAGLDKSGKFQAMHVDMTAESGPYCSVSPFVIWRPTVQCTGPYVVPNVHCDTRAVYTNNTYTGAMRGFGSPQHIFACESFIDMCAEACKLDPVKFRKLNFLKQNSISHTGQKFSSHKVSTEDVMNKALAKIGFSKKFKKCTRGISKNGFYYGIGFACSYRGVSLGAEGNDFCSAIVNIQPDASILLEVGVSENGQGLKTAMTRILAIELGIGEEQIRFLDTDTSSIPDGGPTVASRGTIVGGNAVISAAEKIKKMISDAIIEKIGRSKKPFIFARGKIKNSTNGKTISFKNAVALCHSKKMYLHALGTFQGPPVSWDEETGQGNAYFTYVYACQACELTVEEKTGKVRVHKVVAAHDLGKAVDRQMALGQIFGGVMMGLGFTLMEEIKHVDGMIINQNLNNYKIPRTTDVPEIEGIIIENADPFGPLGAKSLGEPTNELMGGAIANAIHYATGVRFKELPITSQKILSALQSR